MTYSITIRFDDGSTEITEHVQLTDGRVIQGTKALTHSTIRDIQSRKGDFRRCPLTFLST